MEEDIDEYNGLTRYVGHKLVLAKPMSEKEFKNVIGLKHSGPNHRGYIVNYVDSQMNNGNYYKSWSPENVFKEAYHASGNLTLSDALIYLKMGFKVTNSAYKPGYIQLIPPCSKHDSRVIAESWLTEPLSDGPQFGIYDSDDQLFTDWIPSNVDLFTDDFSIVD